MPPLNSPFTPGEQCTHCGLYNGPPKPPALGRFPLIRILAVCAGALILSGCDAPQAARGHPTDRARAAAHGAASFWNDNTASRDTRRYRTARQRADD